MSDRNYAMTDTARLMNDLYDELMQEYGFNSTAATQFVVAAFHGRHQRT